jgi:hypothetical protein
VTEEDMPITEEDIDILENELTECLVCLQPCSTTSQDLFLSNCTCIYSIHPNCFRAWRERSHTNRICLICREELEPSEEEPQEEDPILQVVRQRRIIIFRNPGMETRFQEDVRDCSKKIKDFCNTLCFFIVATFLIAILMTIFMSQLPQGNSKRVA